MPFRFILITGGSARRRCAHLRSIPQTPKPPRSCSSWRKTTTSLRIALRYGRRTNHGPKKEMAAISSQTPRPCLRGAEQLSGRATF